MESTLVDKVAQVAVEVQVLLALSLELRIILEQVVAVEEAAAVAVRTVALANPRRVRSHQQDSRRNSSLHLSLRASRSLRPVSSFAVACARRPHTSDGMLGRNRTPRHRPSYASTIGIDPVSVASSASSSARSDGTSAASTGSRRIFIETGFHSNTPKSSHSVQMPMTPARR